MNFTLSDEQEFLREAARGALARFKTIEEARGALEGHTPTDLWPTAVEAGWPGILVGEDHGGAGLGPMDAMLVFEELGRVLASVPLLGHVTGVLPARRGRERRHGRPHRIGEAAGGARGGAAAV
jgi:alkylation response protein AidB-like acyl-CoA dehydrogenase